MMKRIVAFFLILCLLAPAGTLLASAATTYTSGNYEYTLSSGKATITGLVSSMSGAVSIPSTLNGHSVVAIADASSSADGVFYRCTGITSVSLPSTLTKIGDYSFSWCTGMTSVSIPSNVVQIGKNAFESCRKLTAVTLPDGVATLGDSAFYDCRQLTSVILGSGITAIGPTVFNQCSSLTNISIPKSVTRIDRYAFADCRSLEKVSIPSSVSSIDSSAFQNSNNITIVCEPGSFAEKFANSNGIKIEYLNSATYCLVNVPCIDEGHYDKNEADARVYRLDAKEFLGYAPTGHQGALKRNGNVDVDGTQRENGFEIWLARWNYTNEISWAFRTFNLDGKFKTLSGHSSLIRGSYNQSSFNTTIYFYSEATLLYSFRVTPTNYRFDFNIDVTGVKELKVLAKDNVSASGGTSFALYDLFLDPVGAVNPSASVFNEEAYIADIWLNQGRAYTTIESQLVSEMMDYYSPSSDMYLSLKSDTAFQVAVAGWNGFKTVSDPAGSGKKLSNVSDIYETLILDMLERATNNDVENYNNAFVNALDIAGESADVITDFKDAVDHFDDALAKGSITLDTIRNWKVNPGDDTWVKFSKSFEAAGENNKTPWGESKFVEGIGTIAEGISDVSDFYKRLCAYMYACNMKTDMVEFLTEMGKQSLPSHFRTALNNVLNAVNDTNYASLICTLELGEDLAFDVLKGVWKDLSKLFPIYGFFKTVIDGAMAVDNMLFNTQSIVDKYFLLEATYNYFSVTKSVIGNTKNRYLSNRTEKNAAAYVFAMRNFQYAYEIDLESAVAFTKAADDEGVVNGVKNGARLLSNLITGANEKTNYQKMSDSADSIKASLASLFHTLDTSWKFNVGYLKTDYPDVYPIYVQKELSKAEYTPVITDKYLSQKGSSNIEWFIPYGYTDKDGNYHHMSSYIVDGVDATETASGSTTSRSSALDDGNGYVVEFVNNSTFTSFPKTYSIKGYSNTGSGKVYTGTKTESFENPLKKPIVGIPSDSQLLTNISSGFTAIGIYDATQKRYENIKYKIFRRTATSSWKLLDTIDKTDSFLLHRTIYKDLTATAKQNYYYKVSSYIDFGNGKRLDSPESDVVCMRVSDVVNNAMNLILTPVQNIVHAKAPKKAINKAQTNTGTNDKSGIQLTWNPVSGVSGYEIYRLASYGTTYKLIDTVTTETTSYIDESVSDGITYSYVVIPYVIASGNKEYAPQNNGNNSLSYPCSSGRKITDYAVGDIIEFGSYPQSKVKDGATISALNARATNWQSYGYMSGKETDSYDGSAQSSDYMKYCDIEYNGAYYRGVRFTTYRPNYTSYASTASGDYTSQDENGYSVNTTYWFKYEHLKWRVLNPATGLVLCESIIDSQPYSNTLFNYAGENYKDAQHNYYANNYAQSSIREFLNDTFYETAFSASEQSQIVAKSRENKAFTSSYSQFDSASSTDKITLLTSQDMVNTSYGFSSNQNNNDVSRRTSGTDYAKCQGLSINPSYQSTDGEYSSYWWLRSAGQFSASACSVWYDGRSDISFSYVTLTNYGVRPALNFNLTSAIVSSSIHGSGSGDNPTVPVTGLSINETSMRIGAGSVTTLHATVTPLNATNKAVTWSTSNSSVATVSDSGIVVAKAKGTAIITAKTVDGGKTATCVVTVLNPDELLSVEFLIPVWDHIIVGCGDSYTVRTKINCEAGVRYTVEWKTGSDFMSVDQNGCVTGIKPGSGQVDCVVRDEYGEQVSLILLVDVVQISIPDITITYKQSARLSPEIEGNRYVVSDGSVHYLSNNKNISVNSNGEIETKHGGKETVTCVWTDKTGNYQVTKKCTVTVKYTWWQVLIRIFLLGFIWY